MDQERIGKFICELRKEKNMTQQELADKLNVTDRAVSHWENGRRLPDYSLLSKLCEVLSVSINELFLGERISNEKYKEKAEENMSKLIKDNYSKELLLKTLRENVIVANEEVVLKEEITGPVPTVELDANWWKKNYKTLGWKQGENGYYYVDPKTKIRYSYDPKSEKLIVYKNGKRVANTKCHLYLSGDLGSVTESVTCLNNFGGQKCSAGLKGDPGKLILCPDVHDDKQDNWKNNTYYTTLMGDALVGCAGGNKPSHTIAGFSIGAQTAMKLASSNEYSKGYDKVAVKCLGKDKMGRISFSIKDAEQ